MHFRLNPKSGNTKTGPIPVVTVDKSTCPSTCALKGKGCYAEMGPLGLFWNRMSKEPEKGLTLEQLCEEIEKFPDDQLWRYAQAGDLPEKSEDVLALADANAGRPVLCYTHRRDFPTYQEAARRGFNINISADSIQEADDLTPTGLPVVVVLPSSYRRGKDETMEAYRERLGGGLALVSPGGRKIAICPESYLDDVSCSSCGACSKPRTDGTIIGFPAHGSRRGTIDKSERLGTFQPWKGRSNVSS